MNWGTWLGAFIGDFLAVILVPLFFFYLADRRGRSKRSAIRLRAGAVLIALFFAWAGALGPDGHQHWQYIGIGSVVAILFVGAWAVRASLQDRKDMKEREQAN